VIAAKDLNYPSIITVMDDDVRRRSRPKRTLTNLGGEHSGEGYD
jgi:hypothetical protein